MEYLYVEPYVHINCKEDFSLFYNTLSKDYAIIETVGVFDFVVELAKNRSAVICDRFNRKNMGEIVKLLQSKHMGGTFEIKKGDNFPIIFNNSSKIKHNIDAYRKFEKNISEKSFDFLREISFFINNKCRYHSDINYAGYKQNLIPVHSMAEYNELGIERIEEILNKIKRANLTQINILGGSIFDYSQFHKLNEILRTTAFRISYYINFDDFIKEETQNQLSKYNLDNIVVILDAATFICQSELNRFFKRNITYSIYIQNEEHFEIVKWLKTIDSKLFLHIYPYYNGKNETFFQSNVFSNPNDYLERGISSRQIDKNKLLNMIAF